MTTQTGIAEPVVVAPVVQKATDTQVIEYIIYYILGAVDILLAFRFIFKLTGANAVSPFVNLIYTLTSIFIMPFEGIFRRGVAEGIETTAIFEPSTVVAIIVYAIIAWGLAKLIRVFSGEKQEE